MPNLSVNLSGFSDIAADTLVTSGDVTVGDDIILTGELNGTYYYTGSADPTAGGGVAHSEPAVYRRSGTNQVWISNGAGATSWVRLGDTVDLALKANLASPTFTGVVTTPRAEFSSNGDVNDPFIEGPNKSGMYVIDASTTAICQGGGAWILVGTGGIYVLNHRLAVQHGYASQGVLSPAQITSNQTDYNPFGGNMQLYHNLRLDLDANRTINSLQPPAVDGVELVLWNISAFTLTLLHDDGATGTAGARFLCPNNANHAIRKNGATLVRYDSSSTRWRVLAP